MNSIKFNKRIGGKKQLGQGMTEYIIIVALVAIAAIGVYSAFGHTLTDQVAQVTEAVAGQNQNAAALSQAAKGEADKAETATESAVGMGNYSQNDNNL